MRLAQIEDGVVVNVIEADPAAVPDWAADWPEAAEAGPGWLWDGDGFAPPPEPEPPEPDRTAMTLTFAQLMIGLVSEGWITEAEGDAWLDGTLPAPVLALIATLPEAEQFPARARAKRLIEAQRLDPLVIGLALAEGKTDAELDAFFMTYAQV